MGFFLGSVKRSSILIRYPGRQKGLRWIGRRMGGFKEWVDGWMGGQREKVRGVYGFSSLMKQKKKGKICFVIHIAGFFFLKFFCYEVFAKQKKPELADNYY